MSRFLTLIGIFLLIIVRIDFYHQVDPFTPRTPAPTATLTPTTTPLDIHFEGIYALALDFRAPLRVVLEANRTLLADTRYTVSAYRDIPGWAKITLVPTVYVENAWANIETATPLEVIMRQSSDGTWQGYLIGSPDFAAIAGDLPRSFVDTVSPLPPLTDEYKFPWQNGADWWAIEGWHEGNALDFQPAFSARFAVLASQAGRLRELCSDGSQSLLQIQHSDGRSTYYLHVTMSLNVRRHLLDQIVRQGQYLGELIGQSYFLTPCGQGESRHLHFIVSDRSMSIEGYPLESIAASASCCEHPPIYRSTNVRVDDSVS